MRNYFAILGLTSSATDADVRSAYRRLVKKYHPDAGTTESDEAKFIEVTEAYDYLVDPARRRRHAAYIDRPVVRQPSVDELRRRQEEYQRWAQREEMLARIRMKKHAERQAEEEFKNTLSYKALRLFDSFYNIVFLVVCASMVVIPIWKYLHQDELPVEQRKPFYFFMIPATLGMLFIGLGYYYFYIYKPDENESE